MSSSNIKENANPLLYKVDRERAHARRTPLEWKQLGSFQSSKTSNKTRNNKIVPTTAEDHAILKALVDCSIATNGKGVRLLREAGLTIPHYSPCNLASGPISQIRTAQDSLSPPPVQKNTNLEDLSVTEEEIFDIIRNIQDPEHPHTLEQLGVVSLEQVELSTMGQDIKANPSNQTTTITHVNIRFTPTIPHCSMATLIGLCIRVKLWRSLPCGQFKVDVQIERGTHVSENAINKQLRDKERVCAALENKHLADVVNRCIRSGMNNSH